MSKTSRPSIYETILFILLLSGPPRLRERDPFASLSGEIDWSVLLNAIAWGLAIFWVFLNFNKYKLVKKSIPSFGILQKIALVFVGCLALSSFYSPAPLLTAYRVIQILIMTIFGFFWINKFGVTSTVKHLFAGYVILCLAIGASAIFAPELVFAGSRLRGDLIADTGSVALMAIIVVLSYPDIIKIRVAYFALLILLITLLIMSMTRTAYVAGLFFMLLAVIRSSKGSSLRHFVYFALAIVLVSLAYGWFPTILSWVIRDKDSLSTLSDRIPLWEHTLSVTFQKSPWFGLGFYANRTVTTAYNKYLGTSHSAFVEILSGGGIVSTLVFNVMLIPLICMAVRLFILHGQKSETFTATSLFFITLLTGLTTETMVLPSPTGFTFWLSLTLLQVISHNTHTETRFRIQHESPSRAQPLPATGW